MNALNDFVVAAGSYFGLPEGRVMDGSTVDATSGDMELVLRVVLTSDDIEGIARRMGVMRIELLADEAHARLKAKQEAVAQPTDKELRAQYDQLPAHQKSGFGSFAKYKAKYQESEAMVAAIERAAEVVRTVELPAHVYVPGSMLSAQQLSMAMGMDADGKYAMDPADLTQEQCGVLGINRDGEQV